MTGTITFDSDGTVESMTAFTLDDTLSDSSNLLAEENWVLADIDSNGMVTFDANFTGSEEDQTISLDLGLTNTSSTLTWDTSGGIDSLDDITSTTDLSDLPTFADSKASTDAITSYGVSSATYSFSQDGYSSGTLEELIVDEYGVISGLYSNGETIDLYTVALADFANTGGLYSEGGNLWSATADSGDAIIGQAGSAGFGSIASSTLEGSNVDIATEMTNLVILQSIYQANSKVITTADTLLQTAIGLKR
jgi:flagellar hook protein FlgE